MSCIASIKRIAAVALVLGALVPATASARCVRDVSESGAVGVRCSDGVRGRLSTDDLPPPTPNVSSRPNSSLLGTRGNNSALWGSGAPPSALSSGAAASTPRPYGGGRGDQPGGMYSISRGADAGAPGGPRPQ